jgi:hypothetical protein
MSSEIKMLYYALLKVKPKTFGGIFIDWYYGTIKRKAGSKKKALAILVSRL